MADKKVYWYGPGTLAGTIESGQEIPKSIPKETVASLIKKDKAGHEPLVARQPKAPKGDDLKATIAEMEKAAEEGRKVIEDLTAQLAERDKTIEDQATANDELQAALTEGNKTIEELTGQLTSKDGGKK